MNPHRSLFSQHPLAQLAVAFSAGICAANYLPTRLVFSLIAGVVCSIGSLIFVVKKTAVVGGVGVVGGDVLCGSSAGGVGETS